MTVFISVKPFAVASYYFLFLGSKYSPHNPVLKQPHQVQHPVKLKLKLYFNP